MMNSALITPNRASLRYKTPEIFNAAQGSQYTSNDFTGALKYQGVKISMDGKGRCKDKIFLVRLS
jgi:putative transposase